MPKTKPLEVPRVVDWESWYAKQPWLKEQGQHVLFAGPTQSGKTVLCRLMARNRTSVVVLGTKAKDPSLDAYIKEGYTRIKTWPPTRADWKKNNELWGTEHKARFILWPIIKKREDMRAASPIFAKLFDDIFIEGNWCIVVDEGLWVSGRSGLNLADHLGDTAYGTASNGVSLYILVQRPANVPPVVWTSCQWGEIFKCGRPDDLRALASLGTYDVSTTQAALRNLRGHQFLDLPIRGQAEWSISEVDPAWI